MTTTGTTLFNMDFTEIAEEAWERAGREMRSGYDLRTARRSMNLMTIEWQSKGINMWTMEQGIINLTPGLATYALPTDTIDLLEHVIRTGSNTASTQADLTITRISVSTYATIPNKLQQARPIQVWIQLDLFAWAQKTFTTPTYRAIRWAAFSVDRTILQLLHKQMARRCLYPNFQL